MGFYERMRREVRERGSFFLPCSLSAPCTHCPTYRGWMEESEDLEMIRELKADCMRTCDKVRYYDRYGINLWHQPTAEECEHLIVWVNELLEGRRGGELTPDDRDRLRVWGDRLTLVLAMEEARVAAGMSAIEGIREVLS